MKKNKKIVASVSAIAIMLSSIISVGAAAYDVRSFGNSENSNGTLVGCKRGEYYISSNDYIIGRLRIYPKGADKRKSKGRVYFKYKNFWGDWKTLDGADSGTITRYAYHSQPNEITACVDSSVSYVDCPNSWTSKYQPKFSFSIAK